MTAMRHKISGLSFSFVRKTFVLQRVAMLHKIGGLSQ